VVNVKNRRPDLRPRWSDPNLPAIRDYHMPDGSRKVEVDPDYERRYREHMVATAAQPDYKHDPTYDLRRKR
jgi:hypothetical protein